MTTGGINNAGTMNAGGDIVGRDKIIHGLSVQELVDELKVRGVVQTAETLGLQRHVIIIMRRPVPLLRASRSWRCRLWRNRRCRRRRPVPARKAQGQVLRDCRGARAALPYVGPRARNRVRTEPAQQRASTMCRAFRANREIRADRTASRP